MSIVVAIASMLASMCFSSIVVVPNACLIVTGWNDEEPHPASAVSAASGPPDPHAARASINGAISASRLRRGRVSTVDPSVGLREG